MMKRERPLPRIPFPESELRAMHASMTETVWDEFDSISDVVEFGRSTIGIGALFRLEEEAWRYESEAFLVAGKSRVPEHVRDYAARLIRANRLSDRIVLVQYAPRSVLAIREQAWHDAGLDGNAPDLAPGPFLYTLDLDAGPHSLRLVHAAQYDAGGNPLPHTLAAEYAITEGYLRRLKNWITRRGQR